MLRNRLLYFWMVLLGIVLAGFSLFTLWLFQRQTEKQIKATLEQTLQMLQYGLELDEGKLTWKEGLNLENERDAIREGYWMIGIFKNDNQFEIFKASHRWGRLRGTVNPNCEPFSTLKVRDDVYFVRKNLLSYSTFRKGEQAESGAKSAESNPAQIALFSALPLEEFQHAKLNLAIALGSGSLLIWIAAYFAGRYLVIRALRPLEAFAKQAETLGEENLSLRLTPPYPKNAKDEISRLANSFNSSLARLETAFEQQRRFAANASHELRTPLAVIQGESELALRRERSTDEYRTVLSKMRTQSKRLLELIEKLLYLSRPRGQQGMIKKTSITLKELLVGCAERWGANPRLADLEWKRGSAADEITLNVHPALFDSALDNLVENALAYSPTGTGVQIETAYNPASKCITIAVQNAGPALSSEIKAHLFEPFYRSAEARSEKPEGCGLGLSITRRIVAEFAGEISMQSPCGIEHEGKPGGVRMSISIPEGA